MLTKIVDRTLHGLLDLVELLMVRDDTPRLKGQRTPAMAVRSTTQRVVG